MVGYWIWFLLALAMGLACAIIAKKKGKDAALWFIFGVIFNFFALFVLLKSQDIAKAFKQTGG